MEDPKLDMDGLTPGQYRKKKIELLHRKTVALEGIKELLRKIANSEYYRW